MYMYIRFVFGANLHVLVHDGGPVHSSVWLHPICQSCTYLDIPPVGSHNTDPLARGKVEEKRFPYLSFVANNILAFVALMFLWKEFSALLDTFLVTEAENINKLHVHVHVHCTLYM